MSYTAYSERDDDIFLSSHILTHTVLLARQDLDMSESTLLDVTGAGGSRYKVVAEWENGSQTDVPLKMQVDPEAYSIRTQTSLGIMEPTKINYDLIEELLLYLGSDKSPYRDVDGAVLIFMPGMGEIKALYEQLMSNKTFYHDNSVGFIVW